MTPWLQWTIGGLLVVAAWFVALATPPESAREAPFPVHAALGEEATGRNIQATVTDALRADRVTAGSWTADGEWVVIHLDVAAVVKEKGAGLSRATLDIGERTFSASERPDSLYREALAVGIPKSGSIAFELPTDIEDGRATLTLAESGELRLDSVIVVELDLSQLRREREAELRATEWTNR